MALTPKSAIDAAVVRMTHPPRLSPLRLSLAEYTREVTTPAELVTGREP
ncbi:hypothetical protein [Kitasatospora sp. MAP5-34]|nr:hypothetical protein [Kitasatospora sp. MAP5-34]MDH6580804.1 hypothetical protein [Kitasatospora sp. MAP5-34]